MKKNVAILFGGASPEYPVSLKSAHAVITHIDTDKYNPVMVGITETGRWLRYNGDPDRIPDDTWHNDMKLCFDAFITPCRQNSGLIELRVGSPVFTKLDAAFPVMHGSFGEDGTLQGLLELAGIPVVGCKTAASAVCMDKDISHKLAESAGIGVPRSAAFSRGTPVEEIKAVALSIGFPVFVKPLRAGSSFGITKALSPAELIFAVQKAFQYDTKIIIEESIDGFETGCAIMGDEELIIGEPDEIELAGGFFDYAEKYNLYTSKIHVPARVPRETAEEIKKNAARIYRALDCSGFARIDQFLTPEGRLIFNEANTIPGFTAHSRFPKMLGAIGMSFEDIVDRLIGAAIA